MKIGDLQIIDEREQSNFASGCWDEYLCLTRVSKEEFELYIGGFQVLGQAEDYFNDDGDFDIPDEIDGVSVIGPKNGSIIGGELVKSDGNYGEVKFSDPKHRDVLDWLKSVGWDNDNTRKEIIKLIKS